MNSRGVADNAQLENDEWDWETGFIHEVVQINYLEKHKRLNAIKSHLCGPQMMIKACTKMLHELGVRDEEIACDEY